MVSGPVAQEKQGVYWISIVGTSIKKIRDHAHDAGPAPDGSLITYCDDDNQTISVMNADGSQARDLYKAPDDNTFLYSPTFLPGGKRILYISIHNQDGKRTLNVESRNLQGGDPVIMVNGDDLIDGTFGQPGRFVYSLSEPPPHEGDSNLWELYYDPETGRAKGKPSRLTDWTGFTFLNPSLSLDGKHFSFLNQRNQSAVFVAEIAANGDELKNHQRLTLNESYNWPTGWSADGQTVIFYSNRNGSFDIFKQGVNDRSAQAVATGPTEKWAPQLSPDGKWILYIDSPRYVPNTVVNASKMMRVPIGGGAPEFVMDLAGAHSVPQTDPLSTLLGYPSFRCVAGGPCMVVERKDQQLVFTAFDAQQGRGKELLRLKPFRGNYGLSPDGTRIAIVRNSYTEGNVEIIPFDGGPHQKFSVAPFTRLTNVSWAPDGKSLFVNSFSSRGTAILHTDLAGHVKLLYKPSWEIFAVAVSPDGKHLAYGPAIYDANAWTTATFPAK